MLKMFSNFKKRRENLSMRKYLNAYEADVLIPHLYGSAEELKAYFIKMQQICENHLGDVTFGSALINVVHEEWVRKNFPEMVKDPGTVAHKYFSETIDMISENYIDPLNRFLSDNKDYEKYEKITDLVKMVRSLSFVVSTILDIREKFLIYNLQAWVSKHNSETKELVDLVPAEAAVIAMPLKVTGLNVIGVAEAIRKNIELWQKEILEARGHALSLKVSKWAMGANVVTIITAIAISFLFMRIPTFEEKLEYQRTIKDLRSKNLSLSNALLEKRQKIADESKKNQILLSEIESLKNKTVSSNEKK